jgi:hypothetical protein
LDPFKSAELSEQLGIAAYSSNWAEFSEGTPSVEINKAYLYPTSNLVAPPANHATIMELRVPSSKQMDCPAGVMVAVSLQDLQEM